MKKPKTAAMIVIASLAVFLFLFIWLRSSDQPAGPEDQLRANLYFGGLNISNLTRREAETKIIDRFQAVEDQGLIFNYENREITATAAVASFDSGPSYQNFQYNCDNLANLLTSYKRPGLLGRWWQKIIKPAPTVIAPEFTINEEKFKSFLNESFPESTNPATDAAFKFTDGDIAIEPEKPGKAINWEELFAAVRQRLNSLENGTINIKTKTEYPQIMARDLNGLEQEAKDLTAKPLTLTFQNKQWPVERENIAAWLSIQKNDTGLQLNFSPERITKYLTEKLAPEINVEAKAPRFEIKNGKIDNWQLGADGYELDAAASALKIMDEYTADSKGQIELTIKTIAPETAESLNIKEIVGTGTSNFAGSSSNRRHNIAVGMAAINGLVIKPGEEFSLVKALGAIDAEAGYLPELVIKTNKTVKEYGGGLCQVGTTLFRTALASGLPITARQNHSYRVSYYEPAGTDAAVYDPWPDVRFVNDTGNSLLIQTRMEGNNLNFDFWGVKDGRTVATTKPVIYNITKPAPAKIIESGDLKPGEKKCTEKAHNGADAYFDYTVIYPEGASTTPLEKTKRFKSHYVPWQEVCLIGKDSGLAKTETASSSPTGTVASSTATTTDKN